MRIVDFVWLARDDSITLFAWCEFTKEVFMIKILFSSKKRLFITGLILLSGCMLFAEGDGKTAADFIWMMVAGFMVFFMQAGFALVESGLTRAKNAGNIIMKNLMDFSMGAVFFFLIGWALMYGDDIAGLFGFSDFMLSSVKDTPNEAMWHYADWFFQVVFAATAATIVSGAMAERTKFTSYLIYSAVISAIVYPISGHWIWGGGWLSNLGFHDFAGSTVVHSVGAWAALTGAIILGPRTGKYKNGKSKAIPGHNITFAALGVFILFFGWFGFNPGSTLGFAEQMAHISVTTALAAAAGAIGAMGTVWIVNRKPDVSMTLNGVLAGLVGITAGCAVVSPGAALIIGLIAGILVVFSVEIIDKVFKIDDPVGAVSVHGICGAWGTLAVGLFASPAFNGGDVVGLFYGGGFKQLGIQLLGIGSVLVWVLFTSTLLFLAIKYTVGLRVSKEEELRGLDIEEHGMEAYSGFQIID